MFFDKLWYTVIGEVPREMWQRSAFVVQGDKFGLRLFLVDS